MIVVMKVGATEKEISGIVSRIEEAGFRAHLSTGVERTIIGVIGEAATKPQLMEMLERMPGVEDVVPVSKPFKLASRDFQPWDTEVRVGGVTIGGEELVVMAGPCAVEDERQLLETA